MKKLFYFLSFTVLIAFANCSDDDPDYIPVPPESEIENLSGTVSVAGEDTIYLKAGIKSASESSFTWTVEGETIESTTDSVFKFTSTKPGDYTVWLTCTNKDGESKTSINLNVYGKFKYGTFVLNEGNMTKENGSLIFISPKGAITDSVYLRVNGTELGNGSQDLFIKNKKMYILSQNGKKNITGSSFSSDGLLIVANAETLEKEAAYNEELTSVLSWPTHVVVLNEENVFIRDGKGVYLFNTLTKNINYIEGTKGANKNRMAVAEGKVFVPCKNTVLVLKPGAVIAADTIDMGATVSGVIKSSDGNLWVSTTGKPHKIAKVNAKDHSVIRENELSEGSVSSGVAATPGIGAIGDTLYFSGMGTKIYRHNFNSGTTELMVNAKEMVENATMLYNTIAVHPVTGEVYMNTIKGFGWDFLINNISVFNFSGPEPTLSNNYKDYTHFPAGVFFTSDFE